MTSVTSSPSRMLKFVLLAGAASLVPTGQAKAQQTAETADSDDGNIIIVTARKREESLQEVPISITAIGEDELRDANVFGLEDVAQLTPGLSFRQLGGFSEPTIRGLAQTDQLAIQGNVGVFIDGIFINNRAALEFANLDISQVEVLKGPQSALFGRDTFAGAINYRTRAPEIGEFDATIEGEIGSDDLYSIKGSVNLPLGENMAVRVFGGRSEFDGTINNVRSDNNLGGWDERLTYGLSAVFEAGPLKLNVFAARNEIAEDQPALSLLPVAANTGGASFDIGGNVVFSLFEGDVPNVNSVDLIGSGTGNVGDYTLIYANAEVDLDFATLTFNGSHSDSSFVARFDNVGDPNAVNVPFFGTFTTQFLTNSTGDESDQQSYEIRLASKPDSSFDWLVGYSRYDSTSGVVLGTITPLFADPTTLEAITSVRNRLIQGIDAVFGSVSVPVTDQLNIGGEFRYTWEDQTATDQADIFFLPAFSRPLTSAEASFDYWSGRASIDYKLNDDVLLYAYAARGTKSGGINASLPTTDPNFVFEPERNWTYEIGTKATLWDGRAVVNAALYYIDWTELQSTAPPSLGLGPITFNGIGATSKGIEIDATVSLTDNLTVRAAATYIDASYNDGFIDGAIEQSCGLVMPAVVPLTTCSADVSGNRIARTSKVSFFGSATYSIPEVFDGYDLYGRVDFSHEGSSFPLSLNLARLGPTNLANARIGLKGDNYEFSLWVDNLLNTKSITRVTPVNDGAFLGSCNACGIRSTRTFPGNTRTFGLTAVARFN
ncbi:MAG: TonB-dependent receptor [Pseudomonadota bacterium]